MHGTKIWKLTLLNLEQLHPSSYACSTCSMSSRTITSETSLSRYFWKQPHNFSSATKALRMSIHYLPGNKQHGNSKDVQAGDCQKQISLHLEQFVVPVQNDPMMSIQNKPLQGT